MRSLSRTMARIVVARAAVSPSLHRPPNRKMKYAPITMAKPNSAATVHVAESSAEATRCWRALTLAIAVLRVAGADSPDRQAQARRDRDHERQRCTDGAARERPEANDQENAGQVGGARWR